MANTLSFCTFLAFVLCTTVYHCLAMSPLWVWAASPVESSGLLATTPRPEVGGPTGTTPPPSARLLGGHTAQSPRRLLSVTWNDLLLSGTWKDFASIVASDLAEQIANTLKFRCCIPLPELPRLTTAAYHCLAMSPLWVLAEDPVASSGPLATTSRPEVGGPIWTTPPPTARFLPGHFAYLSPVW